jgi:hypothetical protein
MNRATPLKVAGVPGVSFVPMWDILTSTFTTFPIYTGA